MLDTQSRLEEEIARLTEQRDEERDHCKSLEKIVVVLQDAIKDLTGERGYLANLADAVRRLKTASDNLEGADVRTSPEQIDELEHRYNLAFDDTMTAIIEYDFVMAAASS